MKAKDIKTTKPTAAQRAVGKMNNRQFAEFVLAETRRRKADESKGWMLRINVVHEDEIDGCTAGNLTQEQRSAVAFEALRNELRPVNPLAGLFGN